MKVTPEHPVYVEGKGWLWAENLSIGDRLRRSDGGMARVLAIERVELAAPELVYNFTVKGPHTYFILNVGVLVHNCLGPKDDVDDRLANIGGFTGGDEALGSLTRGSGSNALSSRLQGATVGQSNLDDIFELQSQSRSPHIIGKFPKTGKEVPGSGIGDIKEFMDDEPLESEWVDIDKLIPMHPPDHVKGGEDLADIYANQLEKEGFPLERAIPVHKIEDGRFVHRGGHHRAEAFRRAGYRRVPILYNPNNIYPSQWGDYWEARLKERYPHGR